MKVIASVLAFLFLSTTFAAGTRYDKVLEEMTIIKNAYPDKVSLFSIGKNNSNMDIQALRISSHPEFSDSSKIGLLAVGVHHGNEIGGAAIILEYARKYLREWKGEDYELVLVPVLNIPGFNAKVRTENGIDPNRDYPGPCQKAKTFRLKSTKGLADLLKSRIFSATATIHGYIGTVTYPWGVSTQDPRTKDDFYFKEITSKIATEMGYRYGTSTDVIYPCEGAFEDWSYWERGNWSLLFEIRNDSISDRDLNVAALNRFFTDVKTSPSVDYSFEGSCDARKMLLDRHDE